MKKFITPTLLLMCVFFIGAQDSKSNYESHTSICDGCKEPLIVNGKDVVMYESPSKSARVVPGPVLSKGARLNYAQDVLTRTLSPGLIKVLNPTKIGDVSVKPGDTVEELLYGGEGTCTIRVNGVVSEAYNCPFTMEPYSEEDIRNLKKISKSKTEAWVKVREQTTERVGWVCFGDGVSWSE